MEILPQIINGGCHSDKRGTVCFLNDFDMSAVKRFYIIKHPSLEVKRGWRAHKIEQRWFYVSKGIFRISTIKIDNWTNPSETLEKTIFELKDIQNQVLHVPAGYATCLQALSPDSEVVVFADYGLSNAKLDDYLFPVTHFS